MNVFNPEYTGLFEPWTPAHIIVMVFFAILWIAIPVWINGVRKREINFEKTHQIVRLILASILAAQYLVWIIWEIAVGRFTIHLSFPFNLCDFANILCVILLLTRSYKLYEVVYFWAIAGTIQSYITPNLYFGWPHLEFLVFYLQHGVMILCIIYFTVAEHVRPRLKSVVKTLIWLHVFVGAVYLFNYLTDSNYMFMMADTPHPTTVTKMIQIFGEPPRHMIGLCIVAVLSVWILYLPFGIRDIIARRKKA